MTELWCSLLQSHFSLPARPTAIGSCISQIYVESFPEGTSCPNKEERTATGSALVKRFVTMCSAMNAFAEEPGVLDEWWNNAFNKGAWWGSWRREHIFLMSNEISASQWWISSQLAYVVLWIRPIFVADVVWYIALSRAWRQGSF